MKGSEVLTKKKFNNDEGSKKKWIFISLLIVILIAGVGVGYLFIKQQAQINTPVGNENVNTTVANPGEVKKAFLATKDLVAGEFIDINDFEEKIIDETMALPEDVVTDPNDLIDKRVKVNMKKDQYLQLNNLIHKNAWYEDGDRRIEHVFTDGAIPITIARNELVGKYVDIMLFRKGQSDLVVVAKEPIIAEDGSTLAFNLNTQQIELLKEAATEGTFYIQVYLSEDQAASDVTYMPQN
jgi:hypothetical protein